MSKLFQELKRRNVFRVAIVYVAVAWLIVQVADIVFDNFGTPDWVMKTMMFLLAVGFPLAILFAWAFELTPDGLMREKDVDRTTSITHETGQKLNRTIIAVLVAAVAFLLVDKFMLQGTATDAATAPVEATDKSVAVLPFIAMSRGPDDEYFSDGLTEEILNSLTRVPGLLVTARTSAFHFKGQEIPVPEIAATLGVAHVVEGSVRRDGDQLRVTAQLIRASDGFHLWSENYDRSTEDTFGVQTDIAEKIASALGIFLDDETLHRMRDAGFRNPEAYIAYQKGMSLYNDAHNSWDVAPLLEEAKVWLDRVIELESAVSRAYLARVDYYTHLLADNYAQLSEEQRAEIEAGFRGDLDAAVQTAVDESARIAARFDRALLTGNWRQLHGILDEYMQTAGCPQAAWLNMNTLQFGKAELILELSERLVTCDPQNPFGWWYGIQAHQWLGNFDKAIELGERALQNVEHSTLRTAQHQSYLGAGRFADAEYEANREVDDATGAHLSIAAAQGHAERVLTEKAALMARWPDRPDVILIYLPRSGDRDTANRIAAQFDTMPYGYLSLMSAPNLCMCGAPWDIEVTPNFKKRIEDAGFDWPPASPINWPLKDW